jgi:hypothetical protein
MHKIVHHEVDIDKLLTELNVKVDDKLRTEKSDVIKILDDGAKIVAKFIFIERHFDYYFSEEILTKKIVSEDFFRINFLHLYDQLREVKIEALHSLLTARVGMIKQATNTLRRCFELALYGVFYGITFETLTGGENINPFVIMAGTGIWSENIGSMAILRREIDEIIKEIKKKEGISTSDAYKKLYIDFTRYYLLKFCPAYCQNHYAKAFELAKEKRAVVQLDSTFQLLCTECSKSANAVLIERPVPHKVMMEVVEAKLRKPTEVLTFEINNLYSELSAFVHPNPTSHQHEPDYKLKDLTLWLEFLNKTLGLSIWFYVRGLSYIGHSEKETFGLLESKNYDLNKLTLQELLDSICAKIGDKYIKKKEMEKR